MIVSVYCRDPSRLTAQFFVLRYLPTHFLLTPSPSETFHSTVLSGIDPCQNKHYQLPCLRYQNSLLVPPAVLPCCRSLSPFLSSQIMLFVKRNERTSVHICEKYFHEFLFTVSIRIEYLSKEQSCFIFSRSDNMNQIFCIFHSTYVKLLG